MKILRIINSLIIISFLLISCATNQNINQSKNLKKNTPEMQVLNDNDLKSEVLKSPFSSTTIIEIPEIKMFEDDFEIIETDSNSLTNPLNFNNPITNYNVLDEVHNNYSPVPIYLYGGWKDENNDNVLLATFDYDFAYIFIKNEIISNRVFIFEENSKNIKKNWLGTLDGSIVINKTIGKTNAGKDVFFSSGINRFGNYFFKIRKNDSGEEYGGYFKYDGEQDKLLVHIIAIDSDKNTNEFDYTLIRTGFPVMAANTFICPNWLKGYNDFSDNYSVSFNNGSFEIMATNSYNQTFDLKFEEFNKNIKSDSVYLNRDKVLVQMYGNENVKDIDLDFFYKLDDLKTNIDDDIESSAFLTIQIGEKLTGGGGIVQIEFRDKKVTNIDIYFLQNDGSLVSFF